MRQVLLADDSLSIRQLVRSMLEPEGYMLIEATDGAEALTALRDHTGPLVVLLDYQMPNLNGEDVLREVIGAGPPLSTHEYLVISANASTFPDSFIELLRHLSLRVIPKPFSRETLVTAVAQAVERLDAPPSDLLRELPDA